VAPEDRVSGPGASYVMASFTHLNPKGSRFSNGSYGVYYAGREFETALRETVHHYELFYADSDLGIRRSEPMRVLAGMVNAEFLDVESLPAMELQQVLDPSNYAAGQGLAAGIRDSGAKGLVYPSVRHPTGECIAAFKPKAVGIPIQAKHLEYHWNGSRIDRYFDYEMNLWVDM